MTEDGVFTPEEARKMPGWKLTLWTFICCSPAIIVAMAKCFDVLADEDKRRRRIRQAAERGE